MSAKTIRRVCSFKKALVYFAMVFIAISTVAVILSSAAASSPLKGSLALNPHGLPLARTHPYLTTMSKQARHLLKTLPV